MRQESKTEKQLSSTHLLSLRNKTIIAERDKEMKRDITFKNIWNWVCVPYNGNRVLLFVLCLVLAFIVSARVQQKKMTDTFDKGREAGYVAAELAFTKEPETLADGTTIEQVNLEALYVAKVVYGVQDNTRAGQKMTVWCVINRAANKAYPDGVIDVCKQELQWMGYNDENPAIKRIYDLCYEELVYWHSGGLAPMSPDFVFLSWTPAEITLRTDFEEKNHCKYFYESDWEEFEASRNGVNT